MDGDMIIDEALFSIFKNPHSYTGEDVVEISTHGSIYIQQKVLELLNKIAGKAVRFFLNRKLFLFF